MQHDFLWIDQLGPFKKKNHTCINDVTSVLIYKMNKSMEMLELLSFVVVIHF